MRISDFPMITTQSKYTYVQSLYQTKLNTYEHINGTLL